MASLKEIFASVYRDYSTDGVPSSGAHEPEKVDIRSIGDTLDAKIAAASVGDPDQIEDLMQPYVDEANAAADEAQVAAGEAASGIQIWRSPAATALNSGELVTAKAIKGITAYGLTGAARGAVYRITGLARNQAGSWRMRISDGTNVWESPTAAPTGVADGPVEITLTRSGSTATFKAVVDYRQLAGDGNAINKTYADATMFELGGQVFVDESAVTQAVDQAKGLALPWRSAAAPALTPTRYAAASAIKQVKAEGFTGATRGAVYRFTNLSKNEPTNGDRIRITDAAGLVWANGSTGIVVPGKDDGPVWVTLTRSGQTGIFKVLVDFRSLASGVNSLNDSYANAVSLELGGQVFIEDISTSLPPENPVWRDPASSLPTNEEHLSILNAVSKVEAVGLPANKTYKFTIICRGNATFNDRITIADSDGNTWSNGAPVVPGRADGPVWTKLTRSGYSSYFNVLIDYRKLNDVNGDGTVLSSTSSTAFLLASFIFADQKLREAIAEGGGSSSTATRTLARSLRVAVAGSSITWGQGWLSQSCYLATVDDWLRYQCAETRHGAELVTSGTASTVSNALFFRGSATRLQGIGANAAFDLTGDEISLCIARPRGAAGAAVCELLINGVVHDTFTTYGNPVTSHSEGFTGDGTAVKFDLGRAFTFNHVVTVNGTPIVVAMNTQGAGATIPGGADAMVIRAWSGANVHHFLFFANPPANGAAIAATFDAGESITYMRGSVGQTTAPLTGTNESPYGDGPTVFDPANPAALSSGLDFRATDERAVLTWRFNASVTRQVEVRVKELDPRGTGTPELWLNFATNRMHRLMNAGIGGKDAGELLTDARPVNIADVIAWQPDIVGIEFSANDDWSDHVYRAWQTRTGLTAAQVRNVETANYYAAVRKNGTDDYDVDDQRLPITAITETTATFTASATTFNIVAGDAIVFGDFFGDNRRLAARVVKSWNAGTRTATWGRPLLADDMAGIDALSDIATARVFGAPTFVDNMEGLIDAVRDALPTTSLAIGTGGIPNIRQRRLEGYREIMESICADKQVGFMDFYDQTLDWQYSQPATAQMYLNASTGTTSDGSASYALYTAGGVKPDPLNATYWNLRGWSVKVNGIERINRDCHIYGGGKRGWSPATDPITAVGRGIEAGDDYTLVFTGDVPANGATVIVKYAAEKWSGDDCHPATAGMPPMGYAVNAALGHFAEKSAAMPGRK